MEKYAKVELSQSTLKVYASMWNGHNLPRLGYQPLATLAAAPELLQEWKADLVAEGVGMPLSKGPLGARGGPQRSVA